MRWKLSLRGLLVRRQLAIWRTLADSKVLKPSMLRVFSTLSISSRKYKLARFSTLVIIKIYRKRCPQLSCFRDWFVCMVRVGSENLLFYGEKSSVSCFNICMSGNPFSICQLTNLAGPKRRTYCSSDGTGELWVYLILQEKRLYPRRTALGCIREGDAACREANQ